MKQPHLRGLLVALPHLDPAQLQELFDAVAGQRRRVQALCEIEAVAGDMKCRNCGSIKMHKHGKTRTGIQRYRCSQCGATFSGRSGTRLARIHRPDLFREMLVDMFGDLPPRSLRKLAEALSLSKDTLWPWRHLALQALIDTHAGTELSGIVEADEMFQRESRKGSREWVNQARNPLKYPKPPRPTWLEHKLKGLPLLVGLSRWQKVVLTTADRSGRRHLEFVADRRQATISAALSPIVARDCVLCSDSLPAYGAFASAVGIEHVEIRIASGRHIAGPAHHIQNVNAMHSHYKEFFKLFRGPATKYLARYVAWFAASREVFGADAFSRVLAA